MTQATKSFVEIQRRRLSLLALGIVVACSAQGTSSSRPRGTGGSGAMGGSSATGGSAGTGGLGPVCATGQVVCASGCADLNSDEANCGSCGTACSLGSTCSNGTCACQTGLTQCSGGCVDTLSNAANCGACAAACATGSVCSGGQCRSSCETGLDQCGADCVDFATNIAHCGGCNQACTSGQACTTGTCQCTGAQEQLCGGRCINVQSDPANCGSCGVSCGANACNAGVCATGTGGSGGTAGATTGGSGGTGGATVNPNCPGSAADAYQGVPGAIPGTIEAENYDPAGYLDTTTGNEGGAYRTGDDVDIKTLGAGYAIGWMNAGEWLEYTVNVVTAGDYTLTVRAGAVDAGRTLELSECGVALTAPVAIPQIAAWGDMATSAAVTVHLEAGLQVIRVTVGANDYVDFDSFTLTPGGSGTGGAGGTGGTTGGTGGTTGGTGGTTGGTGGTTGGTGGTTGGTGGTTGGTGGTVSVNGPCDLYASANTPCVAAYSMVRRLSSTYTGPLYQVRRAGTSITDGTGSNQKTGVRSGGTTQDIGQAGGFGDSAAQDAFCGTQTCTVSILYDQSGRGNHLRVAPAGCYDDGSANLPDFESNAKGRSLMVSGHKVYALYTNTREGYRNNAPTAFPTDTAAQGIYEVVDGKRFGTACCWDFGNASKDNCYGTTGIMDAIFFGTGFWGKGTGNGPWFLADFEGGVWAGGTGASNVVNNNLPTSNQDYAFGILKTTSTNYAIRVANAQSGGLTTAYDGGTPKTLRLNGAIILGIGGDNSNHSFGTFFEGVVTAGRPSDATDASVLQNVQAARYGQ
jgi:hypothetical protein